MSLPELDSYPGWRPGGAPAAVPGAGLSQVESCVRDNPDSNVNRCRLIEQEYTVISRQFWAGALC